MISYGRAYWIHFCLYCKFLVYKSGDTKYQILIPDIRGNFIPAAVFTASKVFITESFELLIKLEYFKSWYNYGYISNTKYGRRDIFTSFITTTENRSYIYLYNLRCSYIVQVKYFHKLNFCFLNSSNKQRTMYNYNCSFLPQILKESVYAKLTK